MISAQTSSSIQIMAQKFWEKEINSPFFVEMAQGKEIGHRIADFVDDKTTGLLTLNYTAFFQRDAKGDKVPRSMGDIWLLENDIYHPINIKTSFSGAYGQPNMVSLKKLLIKLLTYQIDSYYLLMVKITQVEGKLVPEVHFVDMLDYLDYVTFDSGPGQIMLKSKSFFEARAANVTPAARNLHEKVLRIVELLEDGERRLILNRKKGLDQFRAAALNYSPSDHVVTPETQTALHLA